jgi:hypothetical protein
MTAPPAATFQIRGLPLIQGIQKSDGRLADHSGVGRIALLLAAYREVTALGVTNGWLGALRKACNNEPRYAWASNVQIRLNRGDIREDKDVCSFIDRFGADCRQRNCATRAVQRDGGDNGSLAHRLEGFGSEPKTLYRYGRQVVHAWRNPHNHVPRALY